MFRPPAQNEKTQSKRDLSRDEISNARKKIAEDLQLEGDFEGLDNTSNGTDAGNTTPNEEDVEGEGLHEENGHHNGSVRYT